ncbi:hypothetical protein N0V88_005140 [Collariella sp. IMI 366227]|nr:hypothetical protein N0V88_005140 [Collariella sp. IMI 366227]
MQIRNKLFLGSFVHSKTLDELDYLHDTAVCVDRTGTIVAVERDCDEPKARDAVFPRLGWGEDDVEVVRAREGQFFFPGFIDTHLHASQYPNVGIFGNSTLLDWLNTYTFPLEASLSDLTKARQVYTRVIRKTLSHGTTCAAYYATISVPSTNLLADLCLAAGQRALIGRVCMDSDLSPSYYRDPSPPPPSRPQQSIAHIHRIDPTASLLRPVVTPRFAPSCSLPLMRSSLPWPTTTTSPSKPTSRKTAPSSTSSRPSSPALTGAKDPPTRACTTPWGFSHRARFSRMRCI